MPLQEEYVENKDGIEEGEAAWHVLTVEEVINEVRSMNWEQALSHAIHNRQLPTTRSDTFSSNPSCHYSLRCLPTPTSLLPRLTVESKEEPPRSGPNGGRGKEAPQKVWTQ